MFDFGFSEIMVIAVVALIVIGPEKLPKTARTLGLLFGRLQRYVNDVKADINREIELDELRKLQQDMKSAASDIHSSMTSAVQQVETSVRAVENDLNAAAADAPKPATPAPEMEPLAVPAPSPVVDAAPAASAAPAPAPAPSTATVNNADPAADPSNPAEPPRQASLPGMDRG